MAFEYGKVVRRRTVPLVTSSSNVIVKFKRVVRFSVRKKKQHEAQRQLCDMVELLTVKHIYIHILCQKLCF